MQASTHYRYLFDKFQVIIGIEPKLKQVINFLAKIGVQSSSTPLICRDKEEIHKMRYYDKEQKLVKIECNQCGAKAEAAGGLVREDFISVDKQWGYFSKKDLEIHSFDLCENCYDRLRAG